MNTEGESVISTRQPSHKSSMKCPDAELDEGGSSGDVDECAKGVRWDSLPIASVANFASQNELPRVGKTSNVSHLSEIEQGNYEQA
eukprot:scaffold89464_cov17-Tisochrysis_lutea.AAC.1